MSKNEAAEARSSRSSDARMFTQSSLPCTAHTRVTCAGESSLSTSSALFMSAAAEGDAHGTRSSSAKGCGALIVGASTESSASDI